MKVCMHGVQKIQLLNLFIILAIICLEPPTPENGDVILSSQVISVDTTATYTCDSGYILVGQTTRACDDARGEIIGTWSGTTPICEGIQTINKTEGDTILCCKEVKHISLL